MSSLPTSSSSSETAPHPFERMFDVTCGVDVVVGTTSITVRDCLKLRPRSVVRLTQACGTDLELSVNGVVIASGEIMIVDESTAIRVVQIAEPPSGESAA